MKKRPGRVSCDKTMQLAHLYSSLMRLQCQRLVSIVCNHHKHLQRPSTDGGNQSATSSNTAKMGCSKSINFRFTRICVCALRRLGDDASFWWVKDPPSPSGPGTRCRAYKTERRLRRVWAGLGIAETTHCFGVVCDAGGSG
jgi:hypothetical protein